MLKVRQPIIVEGRYDQVKISSLVEATIITTEGFHIFKNKEKLNLIRRLAENDRIIILTDSDRAGFLIRSHIAGAVPSDRIIHIYIPEILGKESRKAHPSAQGTLGVEGVPAEFLRQAFIRAGVVVDSDEFNAQPRPCAITKGDLYRLGLSGGEGSALLRRRLLAELQLPGGLSANAMPNVLSRLMTLPELEEIVKSMNSEQ